MPENREGVTTLSVLIYDALGRPVQESGVKRPDTRELAVVQVRDRWSGYPSNGLVPERLARIFKEADSGDMLRQAELFEEMEEKDAHLASQFQVRKLAVQGLAWEITPAGEDPKSKEVAARCRDFLEGLADLDEHILDRSCPGAVVPCTGALKSVCHCSNPDGILRISFIRPVPGIFQNFVGFFPLPNLFGVTDMETRCPSYKVPPPKFLWVVFPIVVFIHPFAVKALGYDWEDGPRHEYGVIENPTWFILAIAVRWRSIPVPSITGSVSYVQHRGDLHEHHLHTGQDRPPHPHAPASGPRYQ